MLRNPLRNSGAPGARLTLGEGRGGAERRVRLRSTVTLRARSHGQPAVVGEASRGPAPAAG